MKKNKLILYLYFTYLILMCWATTKIDLGTEVKDNFMFAMVIFSISCGATYGYYAFYRDMTLFGWKWIKDTFKKLIYGNRSNKI
tara:strand:- start:74146 stop:74397 length:252 start_codon:yes stop_codon:yes gene_type:complete